MVGIIDTTLRDGVQALWSGRLRAEKIVPIAWTIDRVGFQAIDFMAGVQFEVSVKYLKENPWERIRAVRQVIQKTPLMTTIRGRSLTSFDIVPDEVIHLMIERLAAHGFRWIMILEALHDMENIKFCVNASKKVGFQVAAILFYTISPIHTDEYYSKKASELAAIGVDSIIIRDPSGLLTPSRTRQLIPLLKKAVGTVPLQLKSHCTTGLAEKCYLEAIANGVDSVFTAISPLANGPSVPAAEAIVSKVRELGMDTFLDDRRLQDMAEYFTALAEQERGPLGKSIKAPDPDQYEHQIPGGMMSFLRDQLRGMGLEAKLPQVLEEVPRVRQDLGYPVMVTPLSQLIGAQAVLNVIQPERYTVIPDEVKKYVWGYYGKPEGPVSPGLLDKVGSVKNADFADPQAAGLLKNIRKEFGPSISDDDLILHLLFRPEHLREILSPAPKEDKPSDLDQGVAGIIKGLAQIKSLSFGSIQTKSYTISARRTRSSERKKFTKD